MSETPTQASGACLCGELRFSFDLPSKWVAHCHCSLCRRAHGAAFVTWIGVHSQGFRLDDPQQRLHWYASSEGARRGFCANCGSTLFFESARWPGETHIVLANVDTPVDRTPQAHVFFDTHVPWVELSDSLPRKP